MKRPHLLEVGCMMTSSPTSSRITFGDDVIWQWLDSAATEQNMLRLFFKLISKELYVCHLSHESLASEVRCNPTNPGQPVRYLTNLKVETSFIYSFKNTKPNLLEDCIKTSSSTSGRIASTVDVIFL